MSTRNQVSINGYSSDTLKSGLQLYIRRGMTEKALYCAGELGLFKEENIRTQFLQRLMVFFMEDVENLSILNDIHQKLKELFVEKKNEERLISEIVIQLCASSKARVCSHLRAVFHSKYKPNRERYPSLQPLWSQIEETSFENQCALFTKYMNEKNVLAVHYAFQIEASEEKLKKKFQGRSQPVWYLFQEMLAANVPHIEIFIEWYKSHIGTIKEGYMCWMLPLLHQLNIVPNGEYPATHAYPLTWDVNRAGVKMELELPKGRVKSIPVVENEAPFVKSLWKQFYEDGKRMEEGVQLLGETQQGGVIPSESVKPEKKRGPRIAKTVVAPSVSEVAAPLAAPSVAPLAAPSVAHVEEPKVLPSENVVQPSVPAPAVHVEPAQKDKIKPEITISKMNDSFVFIDNIYRSRMTLLDILETRGYQVDNYRKFSPAEATAAAAASSLMSLNFTVTKKNDSTKKCEVRYANVSRPKLETYFDDVEDADSENVEVVVMSYAPVMEAHHIVALKQYMKLKEEPNEKGDKVRRKLRVSFFCIDTMVVNPLKHVLVPKHEIVPEDQHKELMASMYITAKSKFPEIKFHADPIARCIGAVPGDIVKITRPSQSSGETIVYRVCAP